MARLERGDRLGPYEVLRDLGAGGMGRLYLAHSSNATGFQKVVALKVFTDEANPSLASDRLLEEARLVGSLHHPNIAQVYDAGRALGASYFAMEYVPGRSVRELIAALAKRGRGLALGNALWIVQNAAAALHYAHEKRLPDGSPAGIVHRDVCPSNIMVTFDGTVKLIDFGIAKTNTRRADTRPGTIKGSLRYMSPEQYLGQELDRRSDLFSLGIVLFELTTGTRWLRERDDLKAAQVMLHGELPKPSDRRMGYAVELERIVSSALERDRQLRQTDARTLQEQLERFARSAQLEASSISMASVMGELFEDESDQSTQHALADAQLEAKRTIVLGGMPAPLAPPTHTVKLPPAEEPPGMSPHGAAPTPMPQREAPGAGHTLRLDADAHTTEYHTTKAQTAEHQQEQQPHPAPTFPRALVAGLVLLSSAVAIGYWLFGR